MLNCKMSACSLLEIIPAKDILLRKLYSMHGDYVINVIVQCIASIIIIMAGDL